LADALRYGVRHDTTPMFRSGRIDQRGSRQPSRRITV
jgi:hypothetical protein